MDKSIQVFTRKTSSMSQWINLYKSSRETSSMSQWTNLYKSSRERLILCIDLYVSVYEKD